MSEKIVEGQPLGVYLTLVCVIIIIATAAYAVHDQQTINREIKDYALSQLPKDAEILRVEYLDTTSGNGWIKVEVWYDYPLHRCTEYERENEPWKCEDNVGCSGAISFWYNKNTKKVH